MVRLFNLFRETDSTGLSGIGNVAEGIEFSNKKVVICWSNNISSIVVYDNIEDFKKISCSHSTSKIIFKD